MAIEATISLAILKKFEASSLTPIAYPNVSFDNDKPYYRLNILPVPTEAFAINKTNTYQGIIQVDAVVMEGVGKVDADTMVTAILAVLPRGTQLIEDGVTVRFDRVGWAVPAIQNRDEYFIPVNFAYRAIDKES